MSELSEIVKDFSTFVVKKQGINTPFKIQLSKTRDDDFKTYAFYNPWENLIKIYVKDRGLADILRSIAHELIHHKQNQENRLNQGNIPDIGGEIEDEANSIAGQLVKEYGYSNEDKDIYNK